MKLKTLRVLIGGRISGKVAEICYYTRKTGIVASVRTKGLDVGVVHPKAWNIFSEVDNAAKRLPSEQKLHWLRARKSSYDTWYSLFMRVNLRRRHAGLSTEEDPQKAEAWKIEPPCLWNRKKYMKKNPWKTG